MQPTQKELKQMIKALKNGDHVKEDLKKRDPALHSHIKAFYLSQFTLPENFTIGRYDITVLKQPVYENGLLKIVIDAVRGTHRIPGFDGIMFFQNPPVYKHATSGEGSDNRGVEVLKQIIFNSLEVL